MLNLKREKEDKSEVDNQRNRRVAWSWRPVVLKGEAGRCRGRPALRGDWCPMLSWARPGQSPPLPGPGLAQGWPKAAAGQLSQGSVGAGMRWELAEGRARGA